MLPDGRIFGQITQNRPPTLSLPDKIAGLKITKFCKKGQKNGSEKKL
jgi:hypothetical protein